LNKSNSSNETTPNRELNISTPDKKLLSENKGLIDKIKNKRNIINCVTKDEKNKDDRP